MRRTAFLPVLLACTLLWSAPGRADYLWIDPATSPPRVLAGELEQPRGSLEGLTAPRAYDLKNRALESSPQGKHFDLPGNHQGDLRFSARQELEAGVLQYFHARSGRNETAAVADLELVPASPGASTFRLFWKGKPVSAAQVQVWTSRGWRRVLRPAPDGSISLDTPFPGLYLLEVSAKVNGAVEIDGKRYAEVRHTATLSFTVGEP